SCAFITTCMCRESKAIAIENDLRGTLRNFGLKVGIAGTVKFEARIRELVQNLPDLAALVEPLLIVRRVLHEALHPKSSAIHKLAGRLPHLSEQSGHEANGTSGGVSRLKSIVGLP